MTNVNLPYMCYAVHEINGSAIMIRRGESGYYPATIPASRVDEFNERLGVTPAQREAMITGSMFGWDVPGANPNAYDENGNLK